MTPKALGAISALVLLFGLVPLLSTPLPASANTLAVDGANPGCSDVGGSPYCTIQAAIIAAAAGEIVDVASGTYAENLTIDKALQLLGAQANVVASGRTARDATESTIRGLITLDASTAEINGFTLTNPDQPNALVVPVSSPSHSDLILQYNIIDGVGGADYDGGYVHAFVFSRGPDNVTIARNRFNDVKASGKSASAIAILDSESTDASEGLSIEENVFSDIASDTKGAYGVIINNRAGAPGAQVERNAFSALHGGWTHAIGLEGPTPDALVIGNTCTNLTAAGDDNACVHLEDNPDGGSVQIQQNRFSDSGFYGVAIHADDLPDGANAYSYHVDAENNWWNSECGPVAGAAGVTRNVDYDPWWIDPSGSDTAGVTIAAGATTEEQQSVIDSQCAAGRTVTYAGDAFQGGVTVRTNGVIIDLNGATVGSGSPAFTIDADDVTILGPGTLDGWTGISNNASPAILVNAGADNFTLKDVEVRAWADGVEVAGSVASLKIVGNWIHDNSGSGLKVDGEVAVDGVVTIEGNLFKDNLGDGIRNDGLTNPLKAEYNSWGHLGGPNSGDGISTGVDADPFTFAELFLDMDPDAEATERQVVETSSFDVKLKLDAVKLSGFSFKVAYDAERLQLNSITPEGVWGGADNCARLSSTPGVIAYRCQLFAPSAEWHTVGGTVATFNLTALEGPVGPGPWTTSLDVSTDLIDTSAGAVGGVRIYINNAGYGSASLPARDISDTDDGALIIDGLANFTGSVDLQSRTDEGDAVLRVYNQATKSGAILLAQGSSAASGIVTTAYEPGQQMIVGSTYWLVFDRALYLPTTAMASTLMYGTVPSDWQHSRLLDTRPLTSLGAVVLLGGDATNDDRIDINDASCIGGDFNKTSGFTECGAPVTVGGTADVNGDGVVNVLDLALMGGNFYRNSSSWTP